MVIGSKCRPSASFATEANTQQRTRMTELINDTINDCIPYIEKVTYLMALEKSPHLIDIETNALQFLIYEKWNIWAAAQRIVKYWEWKCTMFGEDRALLPIFDISGNGSLNDNEILYLKSGCCALLPKDIYGNCYLFVNRYRLEAMLPIVELIPRLRLLFYILCRAVQDYYYKQDQDDHSNNNNNNIINDDLDSDQTGLVAINLVSSMAPSTTRNLKDLICEAFPIRVIKIHTVFFRTKCNTFSLDQYIIPSYFSINIPLLSFSELIIYYCRNEIEAATKLHQRGVPLESIPSILGGFWSYDSFNEWFDKTLYQYSNNCLNINNNNNTHQIPPPVMVEENVVVSDIVQFFHSPAHSSISNNDFVVKEDMSQNMNYYSNDDDDDDNMNDFVNLDEYFDFEKEEIMNEEPDNTVLSLVNTFDDVAIKTTSAAAAPETDRSMQHVKYVDSTCEQRCNDSVESEDVSTPINPINNNVRIFPNNWTDRWSEKMNELIIYREKMGHCMVPQTYNENLALGAWVKRQRYQYKLKIEGKQSTMSNERIKSLEDIGFIWDSQDVIWYNQLYELQIFKNKYQHCNVPTTYTFNKRLAGWVKRQRRHYKLYIEKEPSSMTQQRINELDKLGFEWDGLLLKKS